MLKQLRQLTGESLIYGLSATISRFLLIFLVPLYTRIFTPEDYGVMSLISTTLLLLSIFVVLALDSSAGRWYWDTEDADDRKCTLASWAWCQMLVSVLFCLTMFVSAERLGEMVVGRRDAAQYFRLVAIVLPLNVFGVVAVSWLRMQRRPWATMFYALGTSLLNIFLSILFVVVLREGLRGVFMAQVGAALVGSLIALALMRDWVSPRRFRWKRLSEMLRFGMPLIPAALAYWIVSFSDRFFVQYYTNTAEVGLYQIGSSIAGLVALLTGAFQLAWGPFAISIHKQEDARRVYAYVLLLYVSVTSFISTAAALFAPEAIRLVATRQYEGASTVVGLLAFSYVMIGLVYIAATGPTIVKTTRPTGIALIAAAGLNILLNILLVPRLGKEGSAIATLISQGLVPLYLFWRAQQLYEIPYRFGPAIGMLALGLSLVWIGEHWQFDRRWLGTAVKLALICLFIPALFLFRIITPSQLRHVQFRS